MTVKQPPIPLQRIVNRLRVAALRPAVLGLIALFVAGCVGLMPSPFRPSPGPKKAPQPQDLAEAFDIVCRNYTLGPDDELTINFQTPWNLPKGSFRLDTLDKLEIKFAFDPSLNEKVIVRPDGMVTVQAIGDIQASSLTPEELAWRIQQRMVEADVFAIDETQYDVRRAKLVTVHVVDFFEKINQLLNSMRGAQGDRNALVVGPDGTLDFPLLRGRVLAVGRTISEVEAIANRLYKQNVMRHIVVSLGLHVAQSRKVYVLGQVGSPGAYPIRQPVTALHAIAMAGGHLSRTADLTSVMLISKNIQGKPIGRRLDLKKIFDVGDVSSAILVKPYDVLFVPKTYIEDVNVFMDEYFSVVTRLHTFLKALGN